MFGCLWLAGGPTRSNYLDCTCARIWHKSCVVNEYGLSSDDTGDERIGRLRDEVERGRIPDFPEQCVGKDGL